MKDIEHRMKRLNNKGIVNGDFVLYWMQASQRTLHNHSLEYSITTANELELPIVVCFGIDEEYPEAYERHFKFMLEGLSEVQRKLEKIGILFSVAMKSPWEHAMELSDHASIVVCDRGYLKHQVNWREELSRKASCQVIQIETDVIFPVEKVAEKEMYSAATLRRRTEKHLDDHLIEFEDSLPESGSLDLDLPRIDLSDAYEVLDGMEIDRSVPGVDWLRGGTSRALLRLKEFISRDLDRYHTERNDPSKGIQSHMSPYLHFGQISPLTIALLVGTSGSPGTDSYLEELIVRRELAFNMVHYNGYHDTFRCLPNWARETLNLHGGDPRKYTYSTNELEEASTHDPFWNAAQRELVITGKMHNYMRMYWGKKILEWTQDPEEAYNTTIYLNNKYNLDGRDPNSYTGIAWCFGKHDRPWTERPIFGKVRYMNDNGLRRKFDIDGYVRSIEKLEG